MKQVEVLLPTGVAHGFDYVVPDGMALERGDLVRVPFGRASSLGLVLGAGTANIPQAKLKAVIEKLDAPSFAPHFIEFIKWAAWYNCAPAGLMLKMALPLGIRDLGLGVRGRKKNASNPQSHSYQLATLSPAQRAAADALIQKLAAGFSVTLLDGVTGSGKTEVYFEAIAQALSGEWQVASGEKEKDTITHHSPLATRHSQILILLPEIALSVQWMARFEARFGFRPLVWHSHVTPAQKREAWKAIASGAAPVVVGARSALFLPYRNLKLIVVDEEHDQAYKQEDQVIYHARDMAVSRARFEKIPVVLASATPSLESVLNAQQGKYAELRLPARHGGACLPTTQLIDMRLEKMPATQFISPKLRDAVASAIARGEQALLFLNRRGYAPLVLCRHCGHRFECAECSSWLVLHGLQASGSRLQGDFALPEPKAQSPKPFLQCHHCHHREPLPPVCPACGEKESLAACGPGVERIEEEARALFPTARIAVMASDQLTGNKEAAQIISDMEQKKLDLLIGTQMIAKGHHFGGLSVVGVVDGDLGLGGGDLRAAEKTYQLLHQLSGRAGREQIPGVVYLQSYQPDHPVMQALASNDRDQFVAAELAARESAKMPPFARLAAVIVEGSKEDAVIKTAKQLAASFPVIRHPSSVIRLLGPAPAPLYRLRGLYRWRLLVRADRKVNLPELMSGWLESVKPPSSVRIKIDIDPVGFL
ncbi:MAG: primosomal protein N' [Alphaproteobacteria bacterium]|nr:primosomal protein N' [Alphaproteobacteria bacterium]